MMVWSGTSWGEGEGAGVGRGEGEGACLEGHHCWKRSCRHIYACMHVCVSGGSPLLEEQLP